MQQCLFSIAPPPAGSAIAATFAQELLTTAVELGLESRLKDVIRIVCLRGDNDVMLLGRCNLTDLVKTALECKPEYLPNKEGNYQLRIRDEGGANLLRTVGSDSPPRWTSVLTSRGCTALRVRYAILQRLPDTTFREIFVDVVNQSVAVVYYQDQWGVAAFKQLAQSHVAHWLYSTSINYPEAEGRVLNGEQITYAALGDQLLRLCLTRRSRASQMNPNIGLQTIDLVEGLPTVIRDAPARLLFVLSTSGDPSKLVQLLFATIGEQLRQSHQKVGILVWETDVFHFNKTWKVTSENSFGKAAQLISLQLGTNERRTRLSYLFCSRMSNALNSLHNRPLDEESLVSKVISDFDFNTLILCSFMPGGEDLLSHSWAFRKTSCYKISLAHKLYERLDESGINIIDDDDDDF